MTDSEANTRKKLIEANESIQIVTNMSSFLTFSSNSYQSYADFNAGSNVIAVKVGQSVELPVTAPKKGTKLFSIDNNNCEAEWMEKSGGGTGYLKITGKKVGTTKIFFSIKDGNASFPILVIVVS